MYSTTESGVKYWMSSPALMAPRTKVELTLFSILSGTAIIFPLARASAKIGFLLDISATEIPVQDQNNKNTSNYLLSAPQKCHENK